MSGQPVRRRVTRACDFCHRRGLKCAQKTDTEPPVCEPCLRYGVECTYDRPTKRRGPAARSAKAASSTPPPSASTHLAPTASTSSAGFPLPPPPAPTVMTGTSPLSDPSASSPAPIWRPSVLVPVFALLKVLQTYYEAVYPIFPYFVWPHFIAKVSSEEHLNNRSFYGTVMAASALALARIRDSAATSNPLSSKEAAALPPPEALFSAAEDAMPKDLTLAADFDYLRTTALLAVTSIQFANPRKMYQHLGAFWTLCGMGRLHDEKRWGPGPVGRVEAEERRRVYWSMYTLDLFTCISFGGVQRTREATSLVQFPSEIDDEYIVEAMERGEEPRQPPTVLSWLVGWNFTSQLYKTLEHALDSSAPSPGADIFAPDDAPSARVTSAAFLDFLDTAYSSLLPSAFKDIQPYAAVPAQDRFGYQAANILVTLQTIRMVAVCKNLSTSTQRKQAVAIAETTLRDICAVPLAYLQGISSPLIHHLVGIYKLLFPITERPLTPDLFVRIRQLLVDMTTLLHRLQSQLTSTINVAQRFRSQISRMDDAHALAIALASRPPSPRQPAPQLDFAPLEAGGPAGGGGAGGGHEQGQGQGQGQGVTGGTAGDPDPPIAGAAGEVDWEAAFELQDVFQDWPFDFFGSWGAVDAGGLGGGGDPFAQASGSATPGGGSGGGVPAGQGGATTADLAGLWPW